MCNATLVIDHLQTEDILSIFWSIEFDSHWYYDIEAFSSNL